jgi:hypothetical protein
MTNTKKWDACKITTLFGQQTLDVLLQTPLILGDGPDILCWKPASSGICSDRVLATEETTNNPPVCIPMQLLQILHKVWDSQYNNMSRLLLGDCLDLP